MEQYISILSQKKRREQIFRQKKMERINMGLKLSLGRARSFLQFYGKFIDLTKKKGKLFDQL